MERFALSMKSVRSDKGTDIDAYWESGSMSFGTEYMRKIITRIQTVLKPDVNARIHQSPLKQTEERF